MLVVCELKHRKLRPRIQQYFQNCLEVELDVIERLIMMGETFVLYLFSDAPLCQRFTFILESFVETAHLSKPVLALRVPSTRENNLVAQTLGVCILPQLRVYVGGMETRRARGTLSHSELQALLG